MSGLGVGSSVGSLLRTLLGVRSSSAVASEMPSVIGRVGGGRLCTPAGAALLSRPASSGGSRRPRFAAEHSMLNLPPAAIDCPRFCRAAHSFARCGWRREGKPVSTGQLPGVTPSSATAFGNLALRMPVPRSTAAWSRCLLLWTTQSAGHSDPCAASQVAPPTSIWSAIGREPLDANETTCRVVSGVLSLDSGADKFAVPVLWARGISAATFLRTVSWLGAAQWQRSEAPRYNPAVDPTFRLHPATCGTDKLVCPPLAPPRGAVAK